MFEHHPATTDRAALRVELLAAANELTRDEPDAMANMANMAALLMLYLPDLNWAGFYRVVGGDLVLGPFQGRPACVRIGHGKGVCGTAWALGQTQLVPDVHAFTGHIACDAASRSELVVPLFREDAVIAVIDLDSPVPDRFDLDDAACLESLARMLESRI
jgi:L-methionine (R)-S-oxide reductase